VLTGPEITLHEYLQSTQMQFAPWICQKIAINTAT
jgi:hypothetical protein